MKPTHLKSHRWVTLAMLACSGLVTFGTVTIAGVKVEPDNSPIEQTNTPVDLAKLEADIGLSPEQKSKLDAMIKDQNARRKTMYRDASLSDADKEAKNKAIVAETRGKIQELLTPDQFAKWLKYHEAGKAAKAAAKAAAEKN